MGEYFTDSSGLAKRYVTEIGSTWVRNLFDPAANNDIYIAAITSVEIISAITRRVRGGTMTLADASLSIRQFRASLAVDYQIVDVSDTLLLDAMDLAEKYALRGYDAVQLAAPIQVNAVALANGLSAITFVSADAELNRAAVSEGLSVDNPNNYP